MLTESVHVRLTVAEKEAARRLAKRDRRPLSNWVRDLILKEMAEELRRRQPREAT